MGNWFLDAFHNVNEVMNPHRYIERAVNSGNPFGFQWAGQSVDNGVSSAGDLEALAREDREWQANREDTAYQRMVADMQAAGLNPWLGIGNGSASSATSDVAQASALGSQLAVSASDLARKWKTLSSSNFRNYATGLSAIASSVLPRK